MNVHTFSDPAGAVVELLEHPAVAIRVSEGGRGSPLRIRTWCAIPSGRLMREATSAVEDVTHVDATCQEITARRVEVLQREGEVDSQTRCGILDAGAEADRSERSGRRKLHDQTVISWPEVAIQAPAQVLVEALGAINI